MICHVNTAIRRQIASLTPLFLCLLLTAPAHADSYLDALEAEAQTMSDDDIVAKEESNWNPQDMSVTDSLSPDLNQPGFEANLKHNFIGSYAVYTRLGEGDKKAVYSAYQQNNNIDEITALIKKLHKDSIEEK